MYLIILKRKTPMLTVYDSLWYTDSHLVHIHVLGAARWRHECLQEFHELGRHLVR